MRIQERWRACNAPVAEFIAVERGDAHPREVDSGQSTRSRMDSGEKGRCASERGRERQGEVENGQIPCSQMDSGGMEREASERGRELATHL